MQETCNFVPLEVNGTILNLCGPGWDGILDRILENFEYCELFFEDSDEPIGYYIKWLKLAIPIGDHVDVLAKEYPNVLLEGFCGRGASLVLDTPGHPSAGDFPDVWWVDHRLAYEAVIAMLRDQGHRGLRREEVSTLDPFEYKEQRGWGIVKPIVDLRTIGPLCIYPYGGHKVGCKYGCIKKFRWWDVCDQREPVWALYFSMNLEPLYKKLRDKWPEWTDRQVKNNRYWVGTKKKLLRQLEYEFLETHPGPWARVLNRGPEKINYSYGIHYNKTLAQIGVQLQWPPEPHPITVQFLGRPVREDLPERFILD